MYQIIQTTNFHKWYSKIDGKFKTLVDSRMKRVKESGELGEIRYLGDKLFEFKWKIGLRIYFTIKENKVIFLIHGGMKNDQKKDIKRARSLQKSYTL